VDGVVGPDGLVWIPLLSRGEIARIDPATNDVVDVFPTVRGPFVLTRGFGDVWAPDYAGRTIWRLRTPRTNYG
jgi:streptogramin lyase